MALDKLFKSTWLNSKYKENNWNKIAFITKPIRQKKGVGVHNTGPLRIVPVWGQEPDREYW